MRNKKIRIEEVIGKIYNYLTVVREVDPYITNANYKSRRWLFKCICGIEKVIIPSNVLNGNVKSCGCKRTEMIINSTKKYYKEKYDNPVENRLYGNYAHYWNPKREFKISKEKFIALVNSNCYYCGIAPFLERGNKTKSITKPLNGIDRIDSSKGYIDGNVVPCCVHCNRAKMDRSVEDFKDWIKLVYNNLNKQ